jgi:hypothetical protein
MKYSVILIAFLFLNVCFIINNNTVKAADLKNTEYQSINVTVPFMTFRNTEYQYINVSIPFMTLKNTEYQSINITLQFMTLNNTEYQSINITLNLFELNSSGYQSINTSVSFFNPSTSFSYIINNNTVYFTDLSNDSTYWTWNFGDGTIISGVYDEHKNPFHYYTIDWNATTSNYTNFTVIEEACFGDFDLCYNSSQVVSFERPAVAEEEEEEEIVIPTELIIALIAVLIIISLVSIFIYLAKKNILGENK